MVILGDTPPVCGRCGDLDPFCCGGEAERAEQPDPIEAFRREYAVVAHNLFRELARHARDHGCEPPRGLADSTCAIYLALRSAWKPFAEMSEAVDWLLLGAVPEINGWISSVSWLREWHPGPWADSPRSAP